MLTPVRCNRSEPRCGHAWFTSATGPYPVCPKCRTSVSKKKSRIHLVWPGDDRPDGTHGWISVDISRYHREPILALNVAYDLADTQTGEVVRMIEATVLDGRPFGLEARDLQDAVKEAGGYLTREGQYPANAAVRAAVYRAMGWTCEPAVAEDHGDDAPDGMIAAGEVAVPDDAVTEADEEPPASEPEDEDAEDQDADR